MKEQIPQGMYPISDPPPDSLFTLDTRQAAETLGIPPAQIMRLARSGRLLFKFTGDRYKCLQSDIARHQREQEQRKKP